MKLKIQINTVLVFAFLSVFLSCNQKPKESKTVEKKRAYTTVEVVTNLMDFNMKDTLQSGWTNFKYINKSEEPHFFIFEKMPDSITIIEYENELLPPFKSGFALLNEGKFEDGMKEFEKIPTWFQKVVESGGVGLTSEKSTSESTLFLDPGIYVMECYVRMPNGMPHTFMGMLKQVVVLDESNGNEPPVANLDISISSTEGISFKDSISAGTHQFKVHFKDQRKYENMLGHDVNLVRMENDSLLTTLARWVNAADMTAFRSPAPNGLTFMGGVQDSPANREAYFKATLTPGSYVLISEIPQAIERSMYKTFIVE